MSLAVVDALVARLARPGEVVVERDHAISAGDEPFAETPADEAGAAGDKRDPRHERRHYTRRLAGRRLSLSGGAGRRRPGPTSSWWASSSSLSSSWSVSVWSSWAP